jgi:hypothetical protein
MPNQNQRLPRNPLDEGFDEDPAMAARQLRSLSIERQRSMASDTEKLLKLAQEVKSEVDKSNSDPLTPVELRKIGEIEKLARDVRQKMSISYVGNPVYVEPAAVASPR